MTNIPTDAELIAFAVETGMRVRTGKGVVSFARAVLTRWGEQQVPAGYALVPVEVRNLYDFMCTAFVPVTGQHDQIAISLDLAKAAMLSAAPQPVEREPLTEAQVQALIEAKHFRNGYELKASDRVCLDWYRLGLRDGERAHGIKGGQHGTE